MKAVVAAFNQEKVLVGVFSVITNLRMELFEALVVSVNVPRRADGSCLLQVMSRLTGFLRTGRRGLGYQLALAANISTRSEYRAKLYTRQRPSSSQVGWDWWRHQSSPLIGGDIRAHL